MPQEKYDIFISYSRKDSAIADKICSALDNVGITYFIDRQGIGGGFEFPAVLAENIVNSQLFLFLASENSYESKFTMSEIIFAFNKKPKNAILPYIIDNSTLPMSLEFVFAGINWRNMLDHPIDSALVDDLLKMLGREREESVANVEKVITEATSQSTNREQYLLSLPDEEFVMFKESNKYGFKLKSTGEIVISPKYDNVESFSEELARVRFDWKFGFVDKTGKEIVPLKYDFVWYFREGLANVKLNGKWGYVDRDGIEVITLKYDDAETFYNGRAKVRGGGLLFGKTFYIDKNGNRVK